MCDREQPGKDAMLFEAGIALNRVAMSKQDGHGSSSSSVEHAATLLANMPEEVLQALLRGRREGGEPSTNRSTIKRRRSRVQSRRP